MSSLEGDGRRAALVELLEGELQPLEGRLRDQSLQADPGLSCEQRQQRLLQALEGSPLQPGMERRVELAAGPQPLRLQLQAGGMQRLRGYDPAAFGGCAAADPAPAADGFPFAPQDQASAAGGDDGLL